MTLALKSALLLVNFKLIIKLFSNKKCINIQVLFGAKNKKFYSNSTLAVTLHM